MNAAIVQFRPQARAEPAGNSVATRRAQEANAPQLTKRMLVIVDLADSWGIDLRIAAAMQAATRAERGTMS